MERLSDARDLFVNYPKADSDDLTRQLDQTGPRHKVTHLPRGGWIVDTKLGGIQYGMVPDTVKDCLACSIAIPTYYVVPSNRFDRTFCVSLCEFEFPAYFSFFAKKRKLNLICTKPEEQAIRVVFQETLLGKAATPEQPALHPTPFRPVRCPLRAPAAVAVEAEAQ